MGPTQSCPTQTPCPTQACSVCPVLPQITLTGAQIIGSPTTYSGSLDPVGNITAVGTPDPSGNINLWVFASGSWTSPNQNPGNLQVHVSLSITSTSNLTFQFISSEFNQQSSLVFNPATSLYTWTWNPAPIPLFSPTVNLQFLIPKNSNLHQQPTQGSVVMWNHTITVY